MKKFCVIANSEKDKGFATAQHIQQLIENSGGECVIASREEYDYDDVGGPTDIKRIAKDTECAIVLGGDGTLIQAAADLIDMDIPLLGINLGTLGFLTEFEMSNIESTINKLFCDEYTVENRMMITGNVSRDGKKIFSDTALNDIVVGRNGFSRIISISIYVNDELINTYHGDGVIISTPTGSTGYSLSAGGPIVKPDSKLMVITPICSHSLSIRSIVVDAGDLITIKVLESKKTQKDEAIATFDGRIGAELEAADTLLINRSEKITKLIRTSESGFFEIIRKKL